MDDLSKDQKDQYATAFAILTLYDGGAEVTSEQISTLLEATGNSVEAFYPIIFANFLNHPLKIAQMIASPGGSGDGGGRGADGSGREGGDAEKEEEEKEEEVEEEAPAAGGGLFGDDDGGDY